MSLNPIYEIRSFNIKKLEVFLAVFNKKYCSLVAVIKGMKLNLLETYDLKPNAQGQLFGIFVTDKKKDEFIIYGEYYFEKYAINMITS